ncbi:MAG TPA: hypothetical protein VFR18_26715, partial [Terriglobia bacterium]|nr:hypothetical protein [Terriglobia bacterium]
GPFQAGHTLIGRIGDFDHDGLLDGELVLAGNSPLDLFVAEGDPIAQRRPWISDIPVPPAVSALLIVNGIVQNFPAPLTEVLQQRDTSQAMNYGFDITERLNAALYDLNSVLSSQSTTRDQKRRVQTARLVIRIARFHIERGLDTLARPYVDAHSLKHGSEALRLGLKELGIALQQLAPELPQMQAALTAR